MNQLLFKSAHELASLIKERKATSYDIVRAHIDHIKKHNSKINAMISVYEEEALELAKTRDAQVLDNEIVGPLHGVPITVKEMFFMKDSRSTVNAEVFKDFVAPEDAIVVERLKESGAIIIGKTNLAHMVMDYSATGEIFPEGMNPYDTSLTPGGSTGGGAAAVAAGFTPLELGSDIAGSCRNPANFCGVYGLKPTEGTVPLHGMMPYNEDDNGPILNMATLGPLGRDPYDLEMMWKIISGPHPMERSVPPIRYDEKAKNSLAEFKIGYTVNWADHQISKQTERSILGYVDTLRKNGVTVEEVAIPNELIDLSLELWFSLFPYATATDLPEQIRDIVKQGYKDGFLKGFKEHFRELDRAYEMDAAHYAEVINKRYYVISEWENIFSKYDILISPISYGTAYERKEAGTPIKTETGEIPYAKYNFPFIACFNGTGHPAMSIPVGNNPNGLPLGIQIVGKYWSEPVLLKFAQLAKNLSSNLQKPSGFAV